MPQGNAFRSCRDPSSILIAFVLPLILLFLFGYGVSLDASRTRIGVVVEEPTPDASDLAASFQDSRYFDVRHRPRPARVRGRPRRSAGSRGIVVIPADFAERARRGDQAPVSR